MPDLGGTQINNIDTGPGLGLEINTWHIVTCSLRILPLVNCDNGHVRCEALNYMTGHFNSMGKTLFTRLMI